MVLCLLLAALCTPIIILVWKTMKTGVNLDHGFIDLLRNAFGGVVVYGVVSEIAAVLLGVPAFLLYRKMQVTSWLLYGIGGAFISAITSALLAGAGTLYFFTGQPEKIHAWEDSLPLLLLCGIVSALVFRAMMRPTYD
jgi:predicted Abi (CAAX) family protease